MRLYHLVAVFLFPPNLKHNQMVTLHDVKGEGEFWIKELVNPFTIHSFGVTMVKLS